MNKKNTNYIGWFMCIALLLFLQVDGYAQHSVSGTVTEADSEEPLGGVNILIKGTTQGTSTNADGTYSISVPSASDTLIFSFVGFVTQQVPINGRSTIDIALVPGSLIGEDIVVLGYGFQRREDVTSAVSSVNSEDFLQASPQDAASLIKGKISGLVLSTPEGDPTGETEISLRGATTLTQNADPLVLVDGVPGELNTVAPENIQSISVLKDGSAAAIYGSRGSNGVILITTQNHTGAQAATINYQGYVNVQQIVERPDMMTGEEYRNAIEENNLLSQDFGFNTNWMDQVLRDPASHNHTLTLSGGDSQTNYSASLNYRFAEGIIITSNNEDLRGRVNVRHSMYDDRLVAGVNLNYRIQNFATFSDEAWYQAISRNPTDRVRDENENWQERTGGLRYYNPMPILMETDGETEVRDLRLSASLDWEPIDNLSLRVLGSSNRISSINGYAESYQHFSTTFNNLNGFASRSTGSDTDNLLELTGNWQHDLDRHSFNLLAGYSWQEVTEEGFFASNREFPSDLFTYNNLESGLGLQEGLAGINSDFESYKLIGFFSRMNYDFDDRFILMGSLRYEGNSRFGADHEWGWFPAVSVGWRISNEAFMQDVGFINELKLRAGFGVTGIPPDDSYQSLASFSFEDFFFNGGQWLRGIEPSRNANPDLKWERKEEINLGMDFSVLDNRLSGSIDLYRRNTKDLLFEYDVPSPPFLFDQILANVGELENEGIEVALEYNAIQSSDLSWTTGITYSTNRNELVSLSNELYQTENNFINAGFIGESVQLPSHRIFVGGEIGNFYGYKAIDIDEDGLWIIEGQDGSPTPYFEIDEDDRQILGNGVPDHNLSWNNSVRYKNFDLGVYIRGAFGFQLLNEHRLYYENPAQAPERGLNLLSNAFHEVFDKRVLGNEWTYVDYYIEDGDYIKIDNVTLGYTFDVSQLNIISNARIYASAQNLFTFTGYDGLDPEVRVSGLTPGYDQRDRYPTTRTFTIGVDLTF